MNETKVQSKRAPWKMILPAALLLVAVIALAVFGISRWRANQQDVADSGVAAMQAEAMAAIEDRWGIRVTQVVATADGGLVDLRYQIIDPDKAIFIFDATESMPRLLVEEDGTEIALNTLPHQHDLEFGQVYFVLYRNVAGAVKPGGLVTVKVGDLTVEHFRVEDL